MADDMRMDPGVADHGKINALCRVLGDSAFRCWIRLLGYAADHKPDGQLGQDPDAIELNAGWAGAPRAFVQEMVKLHLLDVDLYGYHLHNWRERQPWITTAHIRSAQAKYAAHCRWHRTDTAAYRQPSAPIETAPHAPHAPHAPSEPHAPKLPAPIAPPQTTAPINRCSQHSHAPTNLPSVKTVGFTTREVGQRPVSHDGFAPIAGIVDGILQAAGAAPKPSPGSVDRAWELWDAYKVLLRRFGFGEVEACGAIAWARVKVGADPDGYTMHKLISWAIMAGRFARTSKLAYLKKCKGDPTPEQDDEARAALDLAISEVARIRAPIGGVNAKATTGVQQQRGRRRHTAPMGDGDRG